MTELVLTGTGRQTGPGYNNSYWSDPTNIQVNDSNYSQCQIYSASDSPWIYLQITADQLPTNATILGVEVTEIRQSPQGDNIRDVSVCLLDGTTIISDNKAVTSDYWAVGSWETDTFGGAEDLWGADETLTAEFINSGTFGFGVKARRSGGSIGYWAYMQYMTVKVYYSVPVVTGRILGPATQQN